MTVLQNTAMCTQQYTSTLSYTMSNVCVFMCAMYVAVSCLWSENVCLMSCQTENDKREQELQDLVLGRAVSVCPITVGSDNSTSECHNVLST